MPDAESPIRPRFALFALGLVLLVAATALWRTEPPSPRSASAPADSFSAERAVDALRVVLGPGVPHPTGSQENEAVRDRIVARLRELGWATALEPGSVCGRYGVCARLTNVVARRAGLREGPALLLAAHYDSVPAAPGASDDGAGVATLLEVARALAIGPLLEHPVMLLFDDGEEAGLLGAEAFVRAHDVRREIGAVVNVEARGTTGPSLMFETSDGNSGLVSAFARSSPRPVTGSLFYAVYRRLPNDTDLTVFKREGLPGLNLAPIAGAQRYHTPLDDLAHLDRGTLQQEGDSTLGLSRELARSLPLPPRRDAVFFDVLALGVVRWPLAATPLALSVCLGLVVAVLFLGVRRRAFTPSALLYRAWWWPLQPVIGALLAFGAFALLGTKLTAPWPAHPAPALSIVVGSALAPALAPAAVRERIEPWVEWAVGLAWWGVLATAVSFVQPEASYLLLAPLALSGVLGLLAFLHGGALPKTLALVAPALGAALLWLPVLRLAYDALGLRAPALLAFFWSLALGTLTPLLPFITRRARRMAFSATLAVVGVGFALAFSLPAYSRDTPQRLSLALHFDSDTARTRWLVDASSPPVPKSLLAAGGFSNRVIDPAPWLGGWLPKALEAPGPNFELPAPSFLLADSSEISGSRRVRGMLRSARGARSLTLFIPRGVNVTSLSLDGESAALRYGEHWASVTFLGAPSVGLKLELTVVGHATLLLSDHAPGLPALAAPLLAARPETAVPSQLGDVTVASRKIEL